MRSSIRLLVSALAIVCLPALAHAANCGNGKVLLEEKFSKLSPDWGLTATDDLKPGAGGLQIIAKPNTAQAAVNQSGFFNDYEVCVSAKIKYECAEGKCPNAPFIGIIVWGADRKNYYSCDVSPQFATYSVYRLQNNKYLNPIAWTALPAEAIKKGTQDSFDLSVSVKGNHLTCKVNGVVAAEYDGMPPDGGSLFGFETNLGADAPSNATIIFKSVQLRELQ